MTNTAVVTMHTKCNFHCPYCYLGEKTHDKAMGPLSTPDGSDKFVAYFADRGEWEFTFTGGEPTVNPCFFNLCERLASRHKISVMTNLSCDLELIRKHLPPARTTLICSLQPESEADLVTFHMKIERLKQDGYWVQVTFVANPERLDRIPRYWNQFRSLAVPFVVQGLLGTYGGKTYPESYTTAERKLILDHAVHYFTFYNLELRQNIKSAGKPCSAGYRRIVIDGLTGDINPCNSWHQRIGNIYTGEASFFSAPVRCPVPLCLCDLDDGLREALPRLFGKQYARQESIPVERWEEFKSLTGFNPETKAFLTGELAACLRRLFPPDHSRIMLYGGGSHTVQLLKLLREFRLGNNICAILDGDCRKWDTTLAGISVVAPATADKRRPDRIVISSRSFETEIYDELLTRRREQHCTIHRIYAGNPLGELLAHLLIRGETLNEYFSNMQKGDLIH